MFSDSESHNEAISDQILPQIQAILKSRQGHMPERRWEDPCRRLEFRSGEALDRRFRCNSGDECNRFPDRNEDLESTHDKYTIRFDFNVFGLTSSCL